jgi:hypothetical protein
MGQAGTFKAHALVFYVPPPTPVFIYLAKIFRRKEFPEIVKRHYVRIIKSPYQFRANPDDTEIFSVSSKLIIVLDSVYINEMGGVFCVVCREAGLHLPSRALVLSVAYICFRGFPPCGHMSAKTGNAFGEDRSLGAQFVARFRPSYVQARGLTFV